MRIAGTLSIALLASTAAFAQTQQFPPLGGYTPSTAISTVSNGLLAEYHFVESPGATQFLDYSMSHNNATVFGTPTLTGGPQGGVTFSATSAAILPSTLNAAQTFQFYTCTNSGTTLPQAPAIVGGLYNSSGQFYGTYFFGNAVQGLNTIGTTYPLNPTSFYGTSTPVESADTLNGCHTLTWVRGTTDSYYIDGTPASFYQFQTGGTSTITPYSGTMEIGGLIGSSGTVDNRFWWPFPIYYAVVYSRALTAAEVQSQAGALAAGAAARGIAPTAVTFADSGASLLAVGTSITFGYNGAPYTNYLSTTTTPYTATNMGTPTYQLRNMLSECPTRGYGLIPNGSTVPTVILEGGTNDVAGAGAAAVSPLVAFQRLQRTIACYHAAPRHPRVFVKTMLDRGGSGYGGSTLTALHDQYNAYVRSGTSGADGVIDEASIPAFGADGANANPSIYNTFCNGGVCFNSDLTHPTAAGDQYVLGPYDAGMLNLFDSTETPTNPLYETASYTETTADLAIAANPAAGSITITLPPAYKVTGTTRQIENVQAVGMNTVTIAIASGDSLVGSTIVANNSTMHLRSVLGSTAGVANPGGAAGAHWEVF